MSIFQDKVLAGRNAVVVGGTSGINLGIAKRFVSAGANVTIVGRNAEKAAGAVAEIRAETGGEARYDIADVRDYDSVAKVMAGAAEAHGPLDIVIAGQAGNFVAPAVGISSNGFKAVMDIDLLGTFHVFRSSFEHLRQDNSSLIAITAGQSVNPTMFQAHVCAAKAGINMLVQCLAKEWGPASIRVNAISPGPIADTEGMARLAPTPEAMAAVDKTVPLRRQGTKDEIADAAIFLSSQAATYVTGTILDVCGGSNRGEATADALGDGKREGGLVHA
ncbi:MAG: SDR family oxidoreductase [Alphaproteobacteria bacterium]